MHFEKDYHKVIRLIAGVINSKNLYIFIYYC